MLKKLISSFLTVAMVISLLPVSVFATELPEEEVVVEAVEEAVVIVDEGEVVSEEPVELPQEEPVFVETSVSDEAMNEAEPVLTEISFTVTPDVDLPNNDELFAGYADSVLYGYEMSTYGVAAGNRLTGNEKKVYDALVPIIKKIANGDRTSTVISIGKATSGTTVDASVTFSKYEVTEASLGLILEALLTDLCYEMYWYDKTSGCQLSGMVDSNGYATSLDFHFVVAQNYRGSSTYKTNKTKTGAAAAAAANANTVVAKYASDGDYAKLLGYKDTIREMVTYDHDAAETEGYFAVNDDPWQLIYVFDGNPDTNVVCEGYSKAFMYLCDLSTFTKDITCITVSGAIPAGGHMWNIVSINGTSYLVDVTNTGSTNKQFLAGGTGSVSTYYTVGGTRFTYDSETKNFWGTGSNSILTLSPSNYVENCTQHMEAVRAGITPTCTTAGLSEGKYCSVCGATLLEQTVLPKASHDEETISGYAATCTKDGLTDGTKCKTCGQTVVAQTTIPAKGHTEEVIPGYAPTCTETGLSDGKKCTTCNTVLTRQVVLAAKGHTEEIVPGYPKTCTTNGLTDGKKCSVCQTKLASQIVIPAGHTEVAVAGKAATCTEDGLTDGSKCSVCNTPIVAQVVIPAGHTVVDVPGYAQTCTEDGLTDGKQCSVCGVFEVTQNVIPATGHTEVVIPGYEETCTEDGLTDGVECGVCDEVIVAQTVIRANHMWDEGVLVKAATATTPAEKQYSCVRPGCDEVKITKVTITKPAVTSVDSIDSCVGIRWTMVDHPDVAGYALYRKVGTAKTWELAAPFVYETEYIDTDVESGKKYTYTVCCLDANGNAISVYDSKGKGVTFVAEPKLISVENAAGGLALEWNKVGGASKYRVYLKNANGTWSKVTDTSKTTYTYTKAVDGQEYDFTVAALNADGKVVSSYNFSMGARFVSAPAVPSVANVNGGVELSWKLHPNASVHTYEILRKASGESDWTLVDIASADAQCWVDFNVVSGVKYAYTLRAIGIVQSGYNTTGKSITYVAPTVINSIENTVSGVKLTWDKVAGASKYRVYMKNADGTWSKVTDTSKTEYTYTKAKNGVEYTFTVAPLDKDGKKVNDYDAMGKNIVFISAPAVSAVKNQAYYVEITWKAVANGTATNYEVLRKASGETDWTAIAYVDANTLRWEDYSAEAGVKYTYTVCAYGTSVSGVTAGKSITRVEQPALTGAENTTSGIKVTWDQAVGASKYRLYVQKADGTWSKVADTSKTEYTYTKVTNGTEYNFSVAPLNKEGTALNGYGAYTFTHTFLKAPTVSAVKNLAYSVEITWKPVANETIYSYEILRKASGETDWTSIGYVDANTLRWEDYSAAAGVKYTYTVRALGVNPSGITTGKSITRVEQPVLTKIENTTSGVKLTWDKAVGASKYRVYLQKADGTWSKVADTSSTSYTYTKVTSGKTYAFTVAPLNKEGTALNGHGEYVLHYTFVPAPTVSAVKNQAYYVEITWKAVANGAANGYEILRKASGETDWTSIGYVDANTLRWEDHSAEAGVKYTYTVCAYGMGVSGVTAGKSITRVEQPLLTTAENTASGVKITWDQAAGASKYAVYLQKADGTWSKLGETSKTYYTYTKAKNGTEYIFTVAPLNKDSKALNGYGENTLGCTFLSAPTLVSAKCVEDGVKLTWKAVAAEDAMYEVYRKVDGVWQICGNTYDLSYVDTDVTSGEKYTYTVLVRDFYGNYSGYNTTGKSATFYTQAKFSSVANEENGIKLTWDKANGVSKYRVQLKSGTKWTTLTTTTKDSYTYTKAKDGKSYTFRLQALNKSGDVIGTYDEAVIVAYVPPTGDIGTYFVNWDINSNMLPESSTLTGVEAAQANAEIRKALSLLLDRKYICWGITESVEIPASTFVAKGALSYDGTEFYESAYSTEDSFIGYYDVNDVEGNFAAAMEILKKYYTYDTATGKFTNMPSIEYIYNESAAHKAIGEYMQAEYYGIGLNMQLVSQEWVTFMTARKNGGYDIARNGWIADNDDPISFLDMWTSTSYSNDAQFGKGAHAGLAMYDLDLTPWGIEYKVTDATWAATYDVLIESINACTDAEARCEMMHLAEDMLMETGCLCPLYYYH